jgi:hypothetical protein
VLYNAWNAVNQIHEMFESSPEGRMTHPRLVVRYMECEKEEEGEDKVETRNDEKGINCQ